MENILTNDVLIPLDPEIITDKIEPPLRRQKYEIEEMKVLPKFLDKDSRVLELGAGIGFLSAFMRKNIGVEHVTCCEANPVLVEFIKTVHALNDVSDINVINAVATPDETDTKKNENMQFFVTDPFWASSLVKPHDVKKITKVIDVPTYSLSRMINESKANAIVCDIEGGEAEVFQNVDFGNVKYILMELHTHRVGGKGILKVFDAMSRHGFFYHQNLSFGKVVLFQRMRRRK